MERLWEECKSWQTEMRAVDFRCGMVVTVINSQQLWYKIKLVKMSTRVGKGLSATVVTAIDDCRGRETHLPLGMWSLVG